MYINIKCYTSTRRLRFLFHRFTHARFHPPLWQHGDGSMPAIMIPFGASHAPTNQPRAPTSYSSGCTRSPRPRRSSAASSARRGTQGDGAAAAAATGVPPATRRPVITAAALLPAPPLCCSRRSRMRRQRERAAAAAPELATRAVAIMGEAAAGLRMRSLGSAASCHRCRSCLPIVGSISPRSSATH